MKKTLLIILSLGVVLNYSCQKEKLYPVSQTQVSNQDYQPFTTPARILSQVLALYNNLRGGQLYGSRYIVYNEVKADNYINSSNNGITAFTVWNATIGGTDSQITGLWSSGYSTINNCNLFIDGMVAKGNSVVDAATAKTYVAEAKFIRALVYYDLLQLYARPYADGSGSKPGLPLRLTGNSSYANYDLARSSVADVYAQIIKDLDAAETDLPSTYTTGTPAVLDAVANTTRAHKNTAIALKTRVYLSEQKYSNVITEANKIVPAVAPFVAPTGVPNALQSDITKVFTTPYTTTESILSAPFLTTETPGGQSQLCYYFYANAKALGTAEFNINPTGVVADANWKTTDKRRGFIYTSGSKIAMSKFPTLSPYTDWVPVIRYAEVLLNLAEARVRSTNTVDAQAIALLNAIRGRSDATTVFTVAGFANSTALADAIFQERNIELLGEGFRNADLMRLMLPIPGKGLLGAIPNTDPRYIWPMSGDELLYNKLMTPN
ncbi:MAG: RagB/SusD family nutrient uptake outer membrane protein [Bacteroidota bacterium]